MHDDFEQSTGLPAEEMATYLQMYLDETSEQLDALVETLLVLENEPTRIDSLNESFRLIHSIKGSSAMMGLDSVAVLTHHLENHFERLRSGYRTLDRSMMDLILRCIDFLCECNQRLRDGQTLASAPELLVELSQLSNAPTSPTTAPGTTSAAQPTAATPVPSAPMPSILAAVNQPAVSYFVNVRFAAEAPLPELKAELITTRLQEIGVIDQSEPPLAELVKVTDSRVLRLILRSEKSAVDIRGIANIGGVSLVEVEANVDRFPSVVTSSPDLLPPAMPEATSVASDIVPQPSLSPLAESTRPVVDKPPLAEIMVADTGELPTDLPDSKTKIGETVRVDVDRLDNLMNLVGELVVNKARFTQLARDMSPAFKKSSLATRARAFSDLMRRVIDLLKSQGDRFADADNAVWNEHILHMESEISLLDEQSQTWDESRRYFSQVVEAIDHLSRVSESLQRGVLDTRMVPVAPLFNRFKRVVRDISNELKKKINLVIHGENTELDKRMIDELGDPLVHLVRNAIDHGIESAAVRQKRGKPESGTVILAAEHSGNNVLVTVRDDGGGINLEKVKQRIVQRNLASELEVEKFTDREVMEFIWHPGFSTADVVSDISGRGVGMDIVKTRIAELNGIIDIDHIPGQGTCFTIRLPLTLAIIRSLLFRLRHGVFAVPIDNVREIVSITHDQIVNVQGKRTFEVRGEFIPLVDIDDIFYWHAVKYDTLRGEARARAKPTTKGIVDGRKIDVVILHNANKTLGLKVDELHGCQDIVIKSLAENFVHIRGLSGASILGDGSVCLLLDVGAVIEIAADPKRKGKSSERVLLTA